MNQTWCVARRESPRPSRAAAHRSPPPPPGFFLEMGRGALLHEYTCRLGCPFHICSDVLLYTVLYMMSRRAARRNILLSCFFSLFRFQYTNVLTAHTCVLFARDHFLTPLIPPPTHTLMTGRQS